MQKIITVVGTTASGKSDLGIVLAEKFNGEIVSCDSRQIYKGLDLGTGKVTIEERERVVHHLLDIKDPNQTFSLAEYQKLAYKAINDILARDKLPVLVGGTGLYSRAVTMGYPLPEEDDDVSLREEINAQSYDELLAKAQSLGLKTEGLSPRHLSRRVEKALKGVAEEENKPLYDYIQLIPVFPREQLYERIEKRLDARITAGMIQEVSRLKAEGANNEFLESLGLEYRYTNRFINGEYDSFEEYRETLLREIRHFAKRQVTWFKRELNAFSLDMTGDYLSKAVALCEEFLNEKD